MAAIALGLALLAAVVTVEEVGGSSPVPSSGSALAQLQANAGDRAARKPEEVDPRTLTELAHEVLIGTRSGLLLLAVGRNGLGEPRVVFTLFKSDATTGTWFPVTSIDAPMEDADVSTLTLRTTEDLGEIPQGTVLLAYVATGSGTEPTYLTTAGEWRPLPTLGVVAKTGFAVLPEDAAVPPRVTMSGP